MSWRLVVGAALLLLARANCQDENEFYYTGGAGVERSFAQLQPALYPRELHGRPLPTHSLPSPGYNQHPQPFRAPPYLPHAVDYPAPTPRQRYRPLPLHNYQLLPGASTKRPDLSQIHSVAYQNDPSRPEAFLGQITLNNPDVDYLQHNRFKPFDENSLKSNGQSGLINHDDDIDEDQDIFEHYKVTTYNPNRIVGRQRLNNDDDERSSHLPPSSFDQRTNLYNDQNKQVTKNNYKIRSESKQEPVPVTEHKSINLALQPLLEDDISDISSFKELMKNQGSSDVEVINSNSSDHSDVDYDSQPDASFVKSDNLPSNPEPTSSTPASTTTIKQVQNNHDSNNHDDQSEEVEGDGEYVEYYDEEPENKDEKHSTEAPQTKDHGIATDIYDEYDSTDEPEDIEKEINTEPLKHSNSSSVTESFDVLIMAPNNTMVKDDNFKHFVDTAVIDQTDVIQNKQAIENNTQIPILKYDTQIVKEQVTEKSNEDNSYEEIPSVQEVVSVVTTKSVINGTISIPEYTYSPSTPRSSEIADNVSTPSIDTNASSSNSTTENYFVVASVQTSRSVSGARFLPFPTIEQEDKKQDLTNTEEEEERGNSEEETSKEPDHILSANITSSTENLNDKLDSIQSELSSAVLSGSLKNSTNIELITEPPSETTSSTTTFTTPTPSLNVFTLKSTQSISSTEKSAPEPPPVMIKKFTPRVATTSTPKPKKKLVTVMDELPSAFLPPGYKPRLSFKDKRTSTTSTTTTTTTTAMPPSTTEEVFNGTQGRSSGISSKNKVIVLDDKSLLPREYKPKERHQETLKKVTPLDDISKFLPPGYTTEVPETKNKKDDLLDNVQKVDITAFLPKGFKLNATATEKPIIKQADISAFLPPGFNLNKTESESEKDLLSIFKVADVASLLPPGFKLNKTEEAPPPTKVATPTSATVTSPPAGGIKVVFPSRPGGNKSVRKTTPRPSATAAPGGSGPGPVTPKIMKGWPTRASTEFTGWPSPSTTPFSIEKLLAAQSSSVAAETEPTPAHSVPTSTTTTTTTTVPPPSTTPGVCRHDCDLAATIKIVSGARWMPELLDSHTAEWRDLADDVREELNSVYSKSELLKKWYRGVRIDGFSPGSVLVDYFVELADVTEGVNTMKLRDMFHRELAAGAGGEVRGDPDQEEGMQGDQPPEARGAGNLHIGKFVMDPAYTEFIVLPKHSPTQVVTAEDAEGAWLPQWGIAVIVIALASLLFVVIFGVTVLVNRQKSAKAKAPIPLSEDMLRELDKSHMGGDDPHIHAPYPHYNSSKRMSAAFLDQLGGGAGGGGGDSWRSEWTPALHHYMQQQEHHMYGGGSQLYGVGGGGGGSLYGAAGYGAGWGPDYPVPRSHRSRRRSDIDTNF